MAILVTALFVFPVFWLGLTSIKPADALFNTGGNVWFDFSPQFGNYAAIASGAGIEAFAAWSSIRDTVIVAAGAMTLTLFASVPAAYALSRLVSRRRNVLLASLLTARMVPPVAVVIPLLSVYHAVNLRDTFAGVMFAHAALNIPVVILLLKSFFDDVPRETGEAAILDGASRLTVFWRIELPMMRGGIAAAAILAFIFSWTEFMASLFLTQTIRLVSVQLSILRLFDWGMASALAMLALAPALVLILAIQRYLVRGFTWGLGRD